MSSPFLDALRAEVANLREELSQNLTYKRLLEAQRMLALYEVEAPKTPSQEHAGALSAKRYIVQKDKIRLVRRQASNQILEAAKLFLANRTDPTPTADILDHVTSIGLEVGGTDMRNNLSAMLSNSEAFMSNGRSGWTLSGKPLAGEYPSPHRAASDSGEE